MARLSLFLFIAWAGSGLADVTTPSGKVIDCYCTDRAGDRVDLGEVICLHVDGRMFLARCEMSLNNPMWRQVKEGCTVSRLPELSPFAAAEAERS
ncbi:hypothetical protein R3X27_14075 [Tropicimonas sp. TH_r6]|uniref:hypothetical protein n=1 Tax=Tropicimonas sp. TH_r6 TaxID=3082085 RepID=UPI002955B8C7|nr:hypothetical protein [Tropicimonas sp. TH_r6]MDV7143810.1 hypothetical protein [Tropicimonas sp. TH_r6]